MNEYIIDCPCCDKKLKIITSNSDRATVFLLEKTKIPQEELFQKCGIELGIVESEVKKESEFRKNMFSK